LEQALEETIISEWNGSEWQLALMTLSHSWVEQKEENLCK
jgi:hypothetical protein